jgi:hypothetical protein
LRYPQSCVAAAQRACPGPGIANIYGAHGPVMASFER